MKLLLPLLLCFGAFSVLSGFKLNQAVGDVNDEMIEQKNTESNFGFGAVLEISADQNVPTEVPQNQEQKVESFAQEIQVEGKNYMDDESTSQNTEVSTVEQASVDANTQVESASPVGQNVEQDESPVTDSATTENSVPSVPDYPTQSEQTISTNEAPTQVTEQQQQAFDIDAPIPAATETETVSSEVPSTDSMPAYPEQPITQEVPTYQPSEMEAENVSVNEATSAGFSGSTQMESEQVENTSQEEIVPVQQVETSPSQEEAVPVQQVETQEEVAPVETSSNFEEAATVQEEAAPIQQVENSSSQDPIGTTTESSPTFSTGMENEVVSTDTVSANTEVGMSSNDVAGEPQQSVSDMQNETVQSDYQATSTESTVSESTQPSDNINQMSDEPVATETTTTENQQANVDQVQEVPAVSADEMSSEPVSTDSSTQTQISSDSEYQSTEQQAASIPTEEVPAVQPQTTDMFSEPISTAGEQQVSQSNEPIESNVEDSNNQISEMSAEPVVSGMQTMNSQETGTFVANEGGEMGAEPVENTDSQSSLKPEGECLIVYSQCNYEGDSMKICGNVSEMKEFQHEIHSIYVPKNQQITIFQAADYQGDSNTFTESQECLFKPVLLTQLTKQGPRLVNQNLRTSKN